LTAPLAANFQALCDRRDARQQLQDKGLVVIDGSMVWINREVEANMEPYLDSEG